VALNLTDHAAIFYHRQQCVHGTRAAASFFAAHDLLGVVQRLSRIVALHRLFNVGGIPREPLFFWQLHLAVLLTGNFWRLAAQLVWTQTYLVAGVADFFSGVIGPLGARRISAHLLLLPGRIL